MSHTLFKLKRSSAAFAKPPGRDPPGSREEFTPGEVARGVAELCLCIAIFLLPVLFPRLLALPLMAIGGFVLVVLAAWDDHALRK
jgi:hypothetical protein